MKILFKISNEIILSIMIKKKLKDKLVINFLEENLDFFIKNPLILDKLEFPLDKSDSNNLDSKIISFKDWVIKNLTNYQKDIIENAKHNFLTQKKIHNSILKILKINNKKEFFLTLNEHLPIEFDLEVIGIISSDLEMSNNYNLIYKRKELIEKIYGQENQLIMDAVDKKLELFCNFDKEIYSNAIFSLNTTFFKESSLLVFGSSNKHYINNKAYDLLSFFSNVIQEKLNQFSNG